jgi:hypothetical protein
VPRCSNRTCVPCSATVLAQPCHARDVLRCQRCLAARTRQCFCVAISPLIDRHDATPRNKLLRTMWREPSPTSQPGCARLRHAWSALRTKEVSQRSCSVGRKHERTPSSSSRRSSSARMARIIGWLAPTARWVSSGCLAASECLTASSSYTDRACSEAVLRRRLRLCGGRVLGCSGMPHATCPCSCALCKERANF